MYRQIAFCLAVAVLASCANSLSTRPLDIPACLLASAKKSDPEFPDGHDRVLTDFSHVGQFVSSNSKLMYVADQHAVIPGMLAPRGQNYIMFFDDKFRFVGKVGYVKSRPLWCDGSSLFLFGNLDGFATGLSGNVIDVAGGFEHLTAYRAYVYGSSGGIEIKCTTNLHPAPAPPPRNG